MNKLKSNRWFIAILIGIAGGISFELAYLKYNYQPAMQSLMGLTSTQAGILMSVYGFCAMILYAPSGIIADKFNHKKLISFSMAITGILGFVMATYPPFYVLIAIQVLWAFTTVLFMWSATIKSVSMLGSREEQGALLGLSEGARGVGCLIAAFLTLWIFKKFGAENNIFSLKAVLMTYGVIMIALAILCWLFVPDGEEFKKEKINTEKSKSLTMSDIIYVLKLKTTWLCSAIIFGVYVVYACLSYTSSYLIDVFGMTMVTATFIGMIRNQFMRTVSPPLAGLVTAKTSLKSPTKILLIAAVINFISLVILFIAPTKQSLLIPMIGVVLVSSICVYVSRGMYFATIGEVNTPINITGTTIGVASVIGFLPDAFIYIIIGNWQDTLPVIQAYKNIWILGACATIIAIVASILLINEIKKNNLENNEVVVE
ncbi:MFS transporter [Paraclostridium ghonii]|uniref:MFS transporter n=1 Tax=Paraclostridium ghonii TaxID=29358 RepID=UPI00202CFDFD|nr:MFS transporter [Paeniclostridium ghonii]MCM0166190.1 MFS transporter [Paeniclostridium ghonii]